MLDRRLVLRHVIIIMTRILSRANVESLLTMPDVIDAIETGFRECATGAYHIPVRLPLDVPDRDAVVLFMPAYLPRSSTLGAKVVSVFPMNAGGDLPIITGTYMLFDAETGVLLAVMDAAYMTGIRTAATSAVATRYLTRPDARVLGVFGAGVQARFHVEAMLTVLGIEKILVYNRTRSHGKVFAKEMAAQHSVPVYAVTTPDECAVADILVTCTRSPVPLFTGDVLKPGTHINAVGAYTSEMRELDHKTIQRATIVVDTYDGAMAEAGDIIIPMKQGLITQDDIHAELGEVVAGQKPGRSSEDEITVFKSVGFAMEDAVTARLAYERAIVRNVGTDVSL